MNTTNKWVLTILGTSALGVAILTSGLAKANCNTLDYVYAPPSSTQWVQGTDYCAGGNNYAILNYEAGYSVLNDTAFTPTTGFGTSNGAAYYIATGVHCSDGQYYYTNPFWAGPYYQYGYFNYVACPSGYSPIESWGYADLPLP